MRNILFQMMVSADGFFEGPKGKIDWHTVDEEFNEYAIDLLNNVDFLLFGRKTYELMVGYWPTAFAIEDDPVIAEKMNNLPKIVFSKTLDKVNWQNTRLIKENIVDELTKLKQQPGKDMVIFGSSNLALTLIKHGLIDELRIIINPIILGAGHTLFNGISHQLHLELLKTKVFNSGNVMLSYHPSQKTDL